MENIKEKKEKKSTTSSSVFHLYFDASISIEEKIVTFLYSIPKGKRQVISREMMIYAFENSNELKKYKKIYCGENQL